MASLKEFRICPSWPYNLLRVRDHAGGVKYILRESDFCKARFLVDMEQPGENRFRVAMVKCGDTGDFFNEDSCGFVAKIYEGHITLEPVPEPDIGAEWAPLALASRLLDGGHEPVAPRLPLDGFDQVIERNVKEAAERLVNRISSIQLVVSSCIQLVQQRRSEGRFPDEVSDEQACALALYTAGWSDSTESFFYILNATLRAEDRSQTGVFFAMMKLMCNGMSHLKPFRGTLYRGVRTDQASKYTTGTEFVWWGFTSCTTSVEVLESEEFMGTTGDRTLFVIEKSVGFDISAFSWFPMEAEILLPAGVMMLVKGHCNAGNGLHIITLQMLPSIHSTVPLEVM